MELFNLIDTEVKNIKVIDGVVLENLTLKSPFYKSGGHLFVEKQVAEMEKKASCIEHYYELSYNGISTNLSEEKLHLLIDHLNMVVSPVIIKIFQNMDATI